MEQVKVLRIGVQNETIELDNRAFLKDKSLSASQNVTMRLHQNIHGKASRRTDEQLSHELHLLLLEFWRDDPRNGIALCRFHHWGFDNGLFSVSDNYAILISPRANDFSNRSEILSAYSGLKLFSGVRGNGRPDLQALKWHRVRVFISWPWLNSQPSVGLGVRLLQAVSDCTWSDT
jgi:hypothetical protein